MNDSKERWATMARARIDLPAVPTSVAEARHFLVRVAAEWRLPASQRDLAELLVAELAGNAVIHAATPFCLEVCSGEAEAEDDRLHVRVTDGCDRPPVLLESPPDADRGRGLAIIDGLAEVWGVESTPTGKSVWFTVAPR